MNQQFETGWCAFLFRAVQLVAAGGGWWQARSSQGSFTLGSQQQLLESPGALRFFIYDLPLCFE